MFSSKKNSTHSPWYFAGLILTPLRVCLGWLIFSAMWRRILLQPNDLNILSPMYEGLKFNHFLVSSEWITPMIQFLIEHPNFLYLFLWVFTIIEGLIGVTLLLGFLTRLAGLGACLLLCGVMLGAGWLGTTCVDEWQIGIFGMASGLVLFFAGGGPFSLDALFFKHAKRFWQFLSSGPFFTKEAYKKTFLMAVSLAFLVFIFTLTTNQINVGGVWGPFHNPAVKPHITLSDATVPRSGTLKFTLMRDGGPDTYGAFITQLKVLNPNKRVIFSIDGEELGSLPSEQIQNKYLVKIEPSHQSLLVPLAAEAQITLFSSAFKNLSPGTYTLQVVDISNMSWTTPLVIP